MANLVQPPYQQFNDANGKPVEAGYIFIGTPGLSPVTSPLQAYWDAELTQPATNIRTTGGYPSNSGTPARLYTATNYSILVQDKNKKTIYIQLDSVDYINSASGTTISSVDTIADLRGIEPSVPNLHISVGGEVTVGDGLIAPLYYWNATSSLTDNGHSVIKPTSVVGNGRWLWINTNAPMESVNISTSSTLDLNYKNRIFLVDTALAVVLAVPDGDFQGQELNIANKGVSTLEITGSGIPASSFIAESASLTWLGTEWSITYRGSSLTGDVSIGGTLSVDTIAENTLDAGISFEDTVKWKYFYEGDGVSQNVIRLALLSWLPVDSNYMAIHGIMTDNTGGIGGIAVSLFRTSETSIILRYMEADTGTFQTATLTTSTSATYDIKIMSDFDAFGI